MKSYTQEFVDNLFKSALNDWKINDIEEVARLTANSNYIIHATNNITKQKFFLKIYNNTTRAANNCEPLIYNLLTNKSLHLAKKYADGSYHNNKFLIIDFIPGMELLSITENPQINTEQLSSLAKQIITFIEECLSIKSRGYGFLDTSTTQHSSSVQGVLSKWTDFFEINLSGIKKIINENTKKLDQQDKTIVESVIQSLEIFIKGHNEYFSKITPKLIPIDLNLKNFIVDNKKKLYVIDLESFLVGDSLLAYGELFGHVYKSPLGKQFDSLWETWSPDQRKIVHFYALLSNINVFCFQLMHADTLIKLDQSHTWGNSNSFLALMSDHYQAITGELLTKIDYPNVKIAH